MTQNRNVYPKISGILAIDAKWRPLKPCWRKVGLSGAIAGVPVIWAASSRVYLNLFGTAKDQKTPGKDEADMSNESKLRKWAAEAARQAKAEKDADEARRLLSFAQYWTRLADEEDFRRDNEAA